MALDRYAQIRAFVEMEAVGPDEVVALAGRLQVNRATAYRLIRKYRLQNTVEGVVAGVPGWGSGRPRIDTEVERVIEAAVREYYLQSQCPTIEALYREVVKRCKALGLVKPAGTTVRRYVAQISRRRSAGSRGGRGKSEAETMRPGALQVAGPNSQWQIDHSPADIVVVDVATRQPIGRPWLTFVIDVSSRTVVGLHVSLDAPNVISVGMALRHAIMDKSEALRYRGIDADWPGFGLPDTIHTDNGSEFKGQTFAHACANLGIMLQFRPIGAARYGGHIERLIGTAQTEMHLLPGTTFSNVAQRGNYDSDAKASMTLDELEIWLWRFIACDYNRRIHSALSRAPLDAWKAGPTGEGMVPRAAFDTEQLAFDLLPSVGRAITRQGIVLNNVHYFEPFLENLFDFGERRVTVRYDPRDLSRIYFQSSQGIQALRYRNLARPPMSLWELEAARRRLVADGKRLVCEEDIFQARRQNADLVGQSQSETRRQRRQNERRVRGYDLATETAPVANLVEVIPQTTFVPAPPRTIKVTRTGEIETW
ncbi:MAG TPA: Mu transposase C-terminal domain-containing protein [Ensifer sp.]|nr:Mu transposase C-terminal domain-containing protein [Ensifer sp.]